MTNWGLKGTSLLPLGDPRFLQTLIAGKNQRLQPPGYFGKYCGVRKRAAIGQMGNQHLDRGKQSIGFVECLTRISLFVAIKYVPQF
jgi:hypothetical protein